MNADEAILRSDHVPSARPLGRRMRHVRLYVLCSILGVLFLLFGYGRYKEWAAVKAIADEEAEKVRIDDLYAKLPQPPESVPPNVPVSIATVLEAATEIKVISIDPWRWVQDPSKSVIGSTVVKDPETIQRIRDAIYATIVAKHGRLSDCDFEPRHAIEAHAGGVVLDLTICFHCGEAAGGIRHNRRGGTVSVGEAAQSVLNDILTARGVPLSPH
jgi:hypothetical protein